jgi:hypothetical protein
MPATYPPAWGTDEYDAWVGKAEGDSYQCVWCSVTVVEPLFDTAPYCSECHAEATTK